MELRSPLGLALAALIVPLILLYILKVRRAVKPVASTWLWAEARRDLLARSPFRRLVPQVPLLLQIAAILLLALALAGPTTRGGGVAGDHIAIVIDTSASMAATSGDTTRLELAQREALAIVNALSPGAEAMVIDAGPGAKVTSPLDRDRRRLTAAIRQLTVREVEGRLTDALALATDRLRSLSGTQQIVLITDGALAEPLGLVSTSVPLRVIQVGEPSENTAITRIDVRVGVDPVTRRDQLQAFAVVTHFGTSTRDLFVTLRQRNVTEPLASRQLRLAPGESTPVVLTFEPMAGDRGTGLVMELSPGDALAADDRAYGRVPASRKLPVVMIPEGASPWLRRALEADPDVEIFGASLDALGTATIPMDSLVVIDGACPAELPPGDLLILNPPQGPCHRVVVGEELVDPTITSWNEADARLRFLTLDNVTINKARQLELEGERDALVRAREGALISDLALPGRAGTLIGFDVGESNWPLKASFVLFVRNLVEQARAGRARGVSAGALTGAPLRLRVPPEVRRVTLTPPSGEPQELIARAGLAIIPEVSEAGFYHASFTDGAQGSVLAVANLTSHAESDTRPKALRASTDAAATSGAEADAALTSWLWLLALLALGLIALDAFWLTRRSRARVPAAPRPPSRELTRVGSAPTPHAKGGL